MKLENKNHFPEPIVKAAKLVVKAATGVVRKGSFYTSVDRLSRIFYARFVGLPSKRAVARFAGLQVEYFSGLMKKMEIAPRETLEKYQRRYLEYYERFAAESEVQIMERLKENALESDRPMDQKIFLETTNRAEYGTQPPQVVGKQTNIQINQDNTINQITDPLEIARRMAAIEAKLPPKLLERVRMPVMPAAGLAAPMGVEELEPVTVAVEEVEA